MTTITADKTIGKLEAVGIEIRWIAPGTVSDVIESVVEESAVGVPLDGLAVSLEENPVTVYPTPAALKHARTGVTPASTCIAEYGSLVLPCRGDGNELVFLFVETHVVVLEQTDIVVDMATAF